MFNNYRDDASRDLEYKSSGLTKIDDNQYGNDRINVIIAEPSDTYPTISNDFLKLFGHVWLVERWMDDDTRKILSN